MANIDIVVGDIGGFRALQLIYDSLTNRGHTVNMIVDPKGAALPKAWKISRSALTEPPDSFGDVVLISTDSSASAMAYEYACRARSNGTPVIFAADAHINHNFHPWCDVDWGRWAAIDVKHKDAILARRPKLSPEAVSVVGQPTFDELLSLLPKKEVIRMQTRMDLHLDPEETMLLWWSHGTADVFAEDLVMLISGIWYLLEDARLKNLVLVPRLHPKLEQTAGIDCIPVIKMLLRSTFKSSNCRVIEADEMDTTSLSLGADAIITTTSIEGYKMVMLGGPPVVHLVGPQQTNWYENELYETYPYIPDISTGQSLVAWKFGDAGRVIEKAIRPNHKVELAKKWYPPVPSIARVTEFVESVLKKPDHEMLTGEGNGIRGMSLLGKVKE